MLRRSLLDICIITKCKYYKLRIGDYRALIDVDFDKGFLVVEVLDKRGRVYK